MKVQKQKGELQCFRRTFFAGIFGKDFSLKNLSEVNVYYKFRLISIAQNGLHFDRSIQKIQEILQTKYKNSGKNSGRVFYLQILFCRVLNHQDKGTLGRRKFF